jgi:hypothetical protein
MTPEAFIEGAIQAGGQHGVASLTPDQRLVYLIAEAECLSDMEGVEAFLDRYAPLWLREAAAAFEAAFEAVGATEIAAELQAMATAKPAQYSREDRLNELLTGRVGYDFEAIRRVVAERISRNCT